MVTNYFSNGDSKRTLVKKKIHSNSGESIAETLVGLLIIVLASTMLAGSIVSSAKINHATKKAHTDFVIKKENGDSNLITKSSTVVINHNISGIADDRINVDLSTTDDDNQYVFYEQK